MPNLSNQVSLSDLKISKSIGNFSPIPVYDGTTGQLTKSINLDVLKYLFKDRTIAPYRTGIRLGTSTTSIITLYLKQGVIINVPCGNGERKITHEGRNQIQLEDGTPETKQGAFKECYISDNEYFVTCRVHFINKLEVLTCRKLRYIEIIDSSSILESSWSNSFSITNYRLDQMGSSIAKIDTLDLRHNNIDHLYLIGPQSYINKLYFRYQNKFLVFLNLKNSIIYTGDLSRNNFANNLPIFNQDTPGILYNISSIPATIDFKNMAIEKNITVKDVIL